MGRVCHSLDFADGMLIIQSHMFFCPRCFLQTRSWSHYTAWLLQVWWPKFPPFPHPRRPAKEGAFPPRCRHSLFGHIALSCFYIFCPACSTIWSTLPASLPGNRLLGFQGPIQKSVATHSSVTSSHIPSAEYVTASPPRSHSLQSQHLPTMPQLPELITFPPHTVPTPTPSLTAVTVLSE